MGRGMVCYDMTWYVMLYEETRAMSLAARHPIRLPPLLHGATLGSRSQSLSPDTLLEFHRSCDFHCRTRFPCFLSSLTNLRVNSDRARRKIEALTRQPDWVGDVKGRCSPRTDAHFLGIGGAEASRI